MSASIKYSDYSRFFAYFSCHLPCCHVLGVDKNLRILNPWIRKPWQEVQRQKEEGRNGYTLFPPVLEGCIRTSLFVATVSVASVLWLWMALAPNDPILLSGPFRPEALRVFSSYLFQIHCVLWRLLVLSKLFKIIALKS